MIEKYSDQNVEMRRLTWAFAVRIWYKSHFLELCITWAAPWEKVSLGICGQRMPRSACAFAQSDQGLHCPLTESLDTAECTSGEQRPKDILHMRRVISIYAFCACPNCVRMNFFFFFFFFFFRLDTAHILSWFASYQKGFHAYWNNEIFITYTDRVRICSVAEYDAL